MHTFGRLQRQKFTAPVPRDSPAGAPAAPASETPPPAAPLNAEGFYRALGFRTLEPMQIPLGQGIPALLMKKSLV